MLIPKRSELSLTRSAATAGSCSSSPEAKAQLRVNTSEAQRLGIFGAPDFMVNGELFFGQDRLEDAIAWARRTSKPNNSLS